MSSENSSPICSLIRLLKCSRNLSSFGKLSAPMPEIVPSSVTPTSRLPPSVFMKATIVFKQANSMFLSALLALRFQRRVDLNSRASFSPERMSVRICSSESSLCLGSLASDSSVRPERLERTATATVTPARASRYPVISR